MTRYTVARQKYYLCMSPPGWRTVERYAPNAKFYLDGLFVEMQVRIFHFTPGSIFTVNRASSLPIVE